MNVEIEIKLEINENKYNEIKDYMNKNAKLLLEKKQKDIYYSPFGYNFYDQGDRCLRIRVEKDKNIISYKQIHFKLEESYIEEYETRIDDYNIMDKILTELNFSKDIVVNKNRIEYVYMTNFLVALDYVEGLGFFVEIESVNNNASVQDINRQLVGIAKKLELNLEDKNIDGYSNMLYKKRKGEER